MSQSITFQQFDKEKTDALWDDVLSGKYEKDVQQKKEELEKQLPTLEAKIPKYEEEELEFMLYNKDQRLEVYDKAQSEFQEVKDKVFWDYELKLVRLNEFKQRIQSEDKQEILYAIEDIDAKLASECGKHFSDSPYWYDFFSVILFKGVLNVMLEEQDYYQKGALAGIPFWLWVEAFRQANKGIMMDIKTALKGSEYTFEDFADHMLRIKEVVKACVDTNTEMVIYYDTDSSEFQKSRAKMLYDKVMNKKEEFLKPGLLEQ